MSGLVDKPFNDGIDYFGQGPTFRFSDFEHINIGTREFFDPWCWELIVDRDKKAATLFVHPLVVDTAKKLLPDLTAKARKFAEQWVVTDRLGGTQVAEQRDAEIPSESNLESKIQPGSKLEFISKEDALKECAQAVRELTSALVPFAIAYCQEYRAAHRDGDIEVPTVLEVSLDRDETLALRRACQIIGLEIP